jgi:hypothetical protein
VHWAPGIPRALCFQKGENFKISGAIRAAERFRMCVIARQCAAFPRPLAEAVESAACFLAVFRRFPISHQFNMSAATWLRYV